MTNYLKSLPASLVSPNLKNSKPKVSKKLTKKYQRLNLRKKKSLKPEKYFNNPLYQCIWSIKEKTKNRIFFNSLWPTTLNPYLQALFLQTRKIQNQKFLKNNTKISTIEFEKTLSPKFEKYFNNPLCQRQLQKFRKSKKWEAFEA